MNICINSTKDLTLRRIYDDTISIIVCKEKDSPYYTIKVYVKRFDFDRIYVTTDMVVHVVCKDKGTTLRRLRSIESLYNLYPAVWQIWPPLATIDLTSVTHY